MKKLLIALLVCVAGVLIYKAGKSLYMDYQIKKFEEEYSINSMKLEMLISSQAEKHIKLNDLIFACELRKGLWETNVSVDNIQKISIDHNPRYKAFMQSLKKEILNDRGLNDFVNGDVLGFNDSVVGHICTLKNPETQSNKSLYNNLLSKKYKTNEDSIEGIDTNKISQEDLNEYLAAKEVEKKIRMNF